MSWQSGQCLCQVSSYILLHTVTYCSQDAFTPWTTSEFQPFPWLKKSPGPGETIFCVSILLWTDTGLFPPLAPVCHGAVDIVGVLICTRVCKPPGNIHEGPALHSWFSLSNPPSPDHCPLASHLQRPPCLGMAGLWQAAGRHMRNRERVILESESPREKHE